MKHKLKCLTVYFEEVKAGKKTFEARINDRNFQVGDILILQDYTITSELSGREIEVEVTSILHGPLFGIQPGSCVMSIGFISTKSDLFIIGECVKGLIKGFAIGILICMLIEVLIGALNGGTFSITWAP